MDQELTSAFARCWELCRRGETQTALAEALRLKAAAAEQGSDEDAAAASGMIGWFCFQVGEVETGIEHAYAAKTFWVAKGDAAREAWTRSVYAWLLLEAGLTEEAADEAFKALSRAEDSGDDITLSWALNVLGVIFWSCKQLERAQVLCERAVGIVRTSNDANLLGWWLINEAGVHAEIGYRRKAQGDGLAQDSLRLALSINHEALTLARATGDDWSLRTALCNSAEYSIASGDLRAAAEALDVWETLPGTCGTRTAGHFFYTKGQLLMKQGKLTEALSVCANALALAQGKQNIDGESHALRYLSEIYEALGRLDVALAYFKRFHDAQSRVAAEKIQRRARFAEIHYETERFKRLAETASQRADQMALTTMLDPLTGIGNRRRLDQALDEIRASQKAFAIAVVDLDHFKMINDTYSHMVGDDVLKRVAAVLQSALRTSDLVVRLGGEEFVVLMYDVDIDVAASRCTGLNERLTSADWAGIDPGLRVTASIGVAVGNGRTDPLTILELADQRLYMAKAAGRNRVVGAPEVSGEDVAADAPVLAGFKPHPLALPPGSAREIKQGITMATILLRSA